QALGAATGIVMGRAIIRDLYERDRAASMLGWVTMSVVAVPMFGPLIGGILETWWGWRAIFLFIGITSLATVIWAALALPEAPGRRCAGPAVEGGARAPPRPGLRRFRDLCRDDLRSLLRDHRRRAARGHHGDGPQRHRARPVAGVRLDRIHGGQFSRRLAIRA